MTLIAPACAEREEEPTHEEARQQVEPPPAEETQPPPEVDDVEVMVDEPAEPAGPAKFDRVALFDESFPYDAEHPAVGHWHGNVRTEFGWPAASIEIRMNDAGEYEIVGSVTPGNRPHIRLTSYRVEGPYVEFRFPLDPPEAGRMHFIGRVSEDGQRLTGDVVMPNEMIERAIEYQNQVRADEGQPPLSVEEAAAMTEQMRPGVFELGRVPLTMELPEPMAFQGPIELEEDVVFQITVAVAETPGGHWVGHMDLPDQFFSGWVLDKVTREGDRLIINMGGGTVAVFDGVVSEDGQTYAGTYTQLDLEIPFEFARIANYSIPAIDLPEALRPARHVIREARIEHPAGHALAATLTLPVEGEEPYPAVVLVSGTGAQNRDYRMFGHSMFEALALQLADEGIAAIRFDDRGVGESTGQFQTATTGDHASDAAAAFNWLKSLENVDAARIGFIGHDEGSVAGAMAAAEVEDAAFLVMLGGRGIVGYEYDLAQLPAEVERAGVPEGELRDRYIATARDLLEAVIAGADDATLMPLAIESSEAQIAVMQALGVEAGQSADQMARAKLRRLKQPAALSFLHHDPAPAMRAVECPVLAIWGGLDRVAAPSLNQAPIEAALRESGGAITVRIYEGLNHMIQPGAGDTPDDYRVSPVAIDESVVKDIADWINGLGD
jgi:pimeloyl-ACP methyl ester carboxylesterase